MDHRANFNQNQIPKKVIWRKRLELLKRIGIFAFFLLFLYQSYVVYSLSQAVDFPTTSDEADLGLALLEESEASGQGIYEAVNQLLADEATLVRIQEIKADFAKLSSGDELELPAGYSFKDLQISEDLTEKNLVRFDFDLEQGLYLVILPHETQKFSSKADFWQFVGGLNQQKLSAFATLVERKNTLGVLMDSELAKDETKQLLSDRLLTVSKSDDEYQFLGNDNAVLLTLSIDPLSNVFLASGDAEMTIKPENLSSDLAKIVVKLDARSELEKIVSQERQDFIETMESANFQKLFIDQGYDKGQKLERSDGLYYVFTKGSQEISIFMENGTGLIKVKTAAGIKNLDDLTDSENTDTITTNTNASTTGGKKKSLAKDQEIMLLAGKHGSLTDTMILAALDHDKQTVKMISIPRDLSWQGQKINSYYARNGANKKAMQVLVRELEQISGLEIEHFVLVDMYAFIEVIDILGGVDITLAEAVVDPTYKTFDNGRWGTLNYQPGTYHLSGVEALRLARTRHTSSDFARAERQQLILSALKNKAQNLGLKDIPKVIGLAKAVLKRVDTDLGLNDSLNFYQEYRHYKIENRGVLSTANILKSTYSNQAEFDRCQATSGTNCSRGGYILVPRNDDWSEVSSYIAKLLL
ncbi:LCP family protein [Candidatus Gracilibacteria bacterium]|nr:LCP family protein [Candidatus Gracilibacteria bacterium]